VNSNLTADFLCAYSESHQEADEAGLAARLLPSCLVQKQKTASENFPEAAFIVESI